MRFALGLLFLALALPAGCGDKPEPEPPTQPLRGPLSGKARSVYFEDVALEVPEEFANKVRDYGKGQRLFFGPATDGFEPSVQVIRQPFKGSSREWFERWRDKYSQGPRGITRVIESGPATVGGFSGHVLVYQIPEGDRVFMNIAWLWVRGGYGYIVRGLAEQQSFVMFYRRVFERVRDTVRPKP